MAMLIGRRTTYAELGDLPDDGVLYELLDGVLLTRSSPTRRHHSSSFRSAMRSCQC